MGDFFTNLSSTLPGPKTNLTALPGGANVNNYVVDSDYNALRTALFDVRNHSKGYVTPFDYGAVGDNVNNDTTAIQNAINSGRTVIFPDPPVAYRVSAELVISTAGQHIMGMGPKPVLINAITAQIGCIDVQAADVVVANLRVNYTMARTFFTGGSYRGGQAYLRNTAFYTNKDRTRFYNIEANNCIGGLFFSPSLNNGSYSGFRQDWVCIGGKFTNVDFGLLMDGGNRAYIDNVSGNYGTSAGSGNPPHLLYLSENVGNTDCYFGRLYAYDSADGHAYQFKGCTRGTVDSLYANNCGGIISQNWCNLFTYGKIVSVNDRGYSGVGSIYMQADPGSHTQFNDVFLHMATGVNQRAVRSDGAYTYFNKLYVVTNRTGANTDVQFNGTNQYVNDLTIVNASTGGAGSYTGTATVRFSRLA